MYSYRAFSVTYRGDTNRWRKRFVIQDLTSRRRVIRPYNRDDGRAEDQAIKYLRSINIHVDAIAALQRGSLLLSFDTSTKLE